MSEIKIKHRKFEIIEENDEFIIASYKKKVYKIDKFDPKTNDGDNFSYAMNRVSNSGVRTPKLLFIDRKGGYVARTHIEGERMIDVIAKENLSEEMYKQLFENAYFAKVNHITISYKPEDWMFSEGTLYYMGTFFMPFREDEDLIKKSLRLWFPTRELASYLKMNGLELDKSRMKDEYATNKEIVLMTLKYYK